MSRNWIGLIGLIVLAGGGLARAQTWSPSSLSMFALAASETPVTQKSTLTNTGASFNFTAATNQGWMSVSPVGGVLPAGANQEFTITVNVAGLESGTYMGLVTVTPVGQLSGYLLPVQLEVSGLVYMVTPTALELDPVPEGMQETTLTVQFSDGVSRPLSWTVSTQTGGNWLTVQTAGPAPTPVTLVVRANALGKGPGEVHDGTILLSTTHVPGLEREIPVRMSVYAGIAPVTVVPSNLNFFTFGTLQVPPQPVQVASGLGLTLPFSVTKSASATPITVSLTQGQTPASFSVSVDAAQAIELPRQDTITVMVTTGEREVVIPVKTQLEPRRVNAISQVADGGPFKTSITVTNQDNVAALVTLRFHRSDATTGATTAWSPAMEGNPRLENVTIPVGASWTVKTAGATEDIRQGWAEVVSSQQVAGTAVFEQSQPGGGKQEAAVPVNSTLMQRLLLPFDNADGFVTSLAVINVSTTEAALMQAVFRDESGRLIIVDRFPELPPRGHRAFELTRLFPALIGRRGTLDLNATSGQISLLGLRFNPTGSFTSFEAQTLNRRSSGRMSIPQVADGGEFITAITLVNRSAGTASATLRFWRQTSSTTGTTAEWDLALEGGQSREGIQIAPGSSVTVRTAGMSAGVQQGWAEVLSDQHLSGFAVFRQRVEGRPDQEAAVPVNFGTPGRQLLPFDNAGGFTSTVALANLSALQPGVLVLTFRDENGQRLLQAQLPDVPPGGHRAFRYVDLFPSLADKRGAVEFSALNGEMSLLGLRFEGSGAFTSIKAQPLN